MFVVSVRERGKEEHKFTFRKPEIVIGRLRSNDIILPKRNISKRHAKMEMTAEGKIILIDNGSTNGSYVNGKRMGDPQEIVPDDRVFMGDYILQTQVLEEKSAIDDAMLSETATAEPPPAMSTDSRDDRPTVSDVDTSMLEEEMKRMVEELSGPETLVIDPMEVPDEPPSDLADSLAADFPPPQPETDMVPEEMVPEEESADTMRLKEAAQLAAEDLPEEPEEELFDIPLIEEIDDPEADEPEADEPDEQPQSEPEDDLEFSELTPPPELVADSAEHLLAEETVQEELEPVAAPAVDETVEAPVAPRPASIPAEAFAPSVSKLDSGFSAALNSHYPRIARQFDKWMEENRGGRTEALKQVKQLIAGAVGDPPGADLDMVAEQVASELGYLGAVAVYLEDPKVGEVYVASSGQIMPFDWRGEALEIDAWLSCPAACNRLAGKIIAAAGQDAPEGLPTARLADGTIARAFGEPLADGAPALRFVRPFRTTMSLKKLVDTGVAQKDQADRLERAINEGRSILVTGKNPQTLALLVHSIAAIIDARTRILASGDHFQPGTALGNISTFTPAALHSPDFASASSSMGFDWLLLENGSGEEVCAAIEVAGILQIPYVISARLHDPTRVGALAGFVDDETRSGLYYFLDTRGTILAVAGRTKLDSLQLFTLEDGSPKLVPVTA
jgi:pilus assembly protein CpaF